MRKPLLAVVLPTAVAALVTAAPVLAHHSFTAEYDANKPITINGAITKMAWINPHAWLYVDRKESDGKVVNCMPLYRRQEPNVQLLEYACYEDLTLEKFFPGKR